MEFNLPPFFYEIFDSSLPRLGPGNSESTRKALKIALSALSKTLGVNPAELRVLDIGCGNGTQTIELAKQLNCSILAIDNHRPYIDELCQRARVEHVEDKIVTRLADMNKLKLDNESLDLIWSEGAFFIMGITEALERFHPYLMKGGVLAFSDLLWLKEDIPAECRDYFQQLCPNIPDIASVLESLPAIGCEIINHFTLPEETWLDHFYIPLENRLRELRSKYADETDKIALIESVEKEIYLYRKYSEYYGYEFFIMKRK